MLHLFSKETPTAATMASLSSITKKLSKPFLISGALLLSTFSGNMVQACATEEVADASSLRPGGHPMADTLIKEYRALSHENQQEEGSFKASKTATLHYNPSTEKATYTSAKRSPAELVQPERKSILKRLGDLRNKVIEEHFKALEHEFLTVLFRAALGGYEDRTYETADRLKAAIGLSESIDRPEYIQGLINTAVEEEINTYLNTQTQQDETLISTPDFTLLTTEDPNLSINTALLGLLEDISIPGDTEKDAELLIFKTNAIQAIFGPFFPKDKESLKQAANLGSINLKIRPQPLPSTQKDLPMAEMEVENARIQLLNGLKTRALKAAQITLIQTLQEAILTPEAHEERVIATQNDFIDAQSALKKAGFNNKGHRGTWIGSYFDDEHYVEPSDDDAEDANTAPATEDADAATPVAADAGGENNATES